MENQEEKFDRAGWMSFLIPFFLGGLVFSFVGISYLNSLPQQIVSLPDRLYAIFLAFFDMGLACGIIGFTILSLFRKVRPLVAKLAERAKQKQKAV